MKTLFKIIIISCVANCQASSITYTYGSFPDRDTGFYYSDGRGNSISVGRTQNVPYIYNNYPSAVWVDATNDRMPANLIVYQYINGYPSYLCRVGINGQWRYGQFIANEGCVLENDENTSFSSFQVLIR